MDMKKILLAAVMALFVMPSFAREEEPIASTSDGKLTFDMVSHIGYGYHFVQSSAFKPGWCGDFFLNILKVGFYPSDVVGLEVSVDADFKNFNSKDVRFFGDADHKAQVSPFSAVADGAAFSKARGGLNVFSLNAPVQVKLNIGRVRLGLGAEATYNIAGDTYYHYRQDNKRTEITENKVALNPFSYGFIASLGINDGCFFFKYYPKSSRILPEGSVDLSFMTLGIAFGF